MDKPFSSTKQTQGLLFLVWVAPVTLLGLGRWWESNYTPFLFFPFFLLPLYSQPIWQVISNTTMLYLFVADCQFISCTFQNLRATYDHILSVFHPTFHLLGKHALLILLIRNLFSCTGKWLYLDKSSWFLQSSLHVVVFVKTCSQWLFREGSKK